MTPLTKVFIFLFSVAAFAVLLYIIGGIWFKGKRSTYLRLFFSIGLLESFWVLLNGVNVMLAPETYEVIYPVVLMFMCTLPSLMLLYFLYFTESKFATSKLIKRILFVASAFDVILLLTNPIHGEFISSYEGIRPVPGSLFPVHAIISYLPLLLSIVLLSAYVIRNIKRTPELFYIAFGIFLPIVFNVLYTFNIFDLGFDITPYAFLLMYAFFTLYSVRMRLFNIKETAITSLFASLSDALLVIDNSGIIAEANPAFTTAFPKLDIKSDKTTAKDVTDYLRAISVDSSEEIFDDFLSETKDIKRAEIAFITNGEKRNYSLSKDMITERGHYAGYIITLTDISNYRRMIIEINERNEKLVELKNIAESASTAKSDFLSRMSHEIRTPLNAIVGMTQIAKKTATDEKTIGSIKEISAASSHLLSLVNDILDMSKIEAGKFDMANEPFEILASLDEVANIITPRCEEKSLRFCIKYDRTKNIAVMGDKLRFKQVILNLLSNALKFTPNGGEIGIHMKIKQESKTWTALEFAVTDTGIGISEEQKSRLFTAFEQASSSTATHYGGTGLGLTISQNLVERMGGKIDVRSKVGVGSVFSFTIRLEKAEDPEEKAKVFSIPNLSDKHMLLVEDVEINRLIIKELLDETYINIEEAFDGKEAVEKFNSSAEGHYDIIFMDVQMPNMNGYEATREIRALSRDDAASIPIIALTANAYREDVNKAIESGMNDHLSKPVDFTAVIEVLNNRLLN